MASRLYARFPDRSMVVERYSLPLLQNIMAHMDLVIAMDSLPLHLCGTTHTPSFSVFGPSLAQKYKPVGERHHCVQGECSYGEKFYKRCSQLRTCKTGHCMKALTGKELYKLFDPWWQNGCKGF